MSQPPRFVVLGAGGLGCPALLGLLGAGVKRITIVDHDAVEASNLHRQVLFTLADVGAAKVEAARTRLLSRDPTLEIHTVERRLDPTGVAALIDETGADVVLECTDDPALKFAVNDACVARNVPAVIAAVLRWRGQAIAVSDGSTCYRCVYEAPPPLELTPQCSEAGVLGAAAGTLGFFMAHMGVRLAAGDVLARGRLIDLDLKDARIRELAPAPRPDCPACVRRAAVSPSPPAQPSLRPA